MHNFHLVGVVVWKYAVDSWTDVKISDKSDLVGFSSFVSESTPLILFWISLASYFPLISRVRASPSSYESLA